LEADVSQKRKKPPARRSDPASDADRAAPRRRNSWEPQVVVPHQVDLPLTPPDHRDEVVVPAAPNGRSLVNGRL